MLVSSTSSFDLLGVVGSCSELSCRLLYESRRDIVLKIKGENDVFLKQNWDYPTVHLIEHKNRTEIVGSLGNVSFSFLREGDVAFLSCNRLAENSGDLDMYKKLKSNHPSRVYHLGDQVYLDRVFKKFVSGEYQTYEG